MKIIPLLLCVLISCSISDTKSPTQSLVSLDSVLQDLITEVRLSQWLDTGGVRTFKARIERNLPQHTTPRFTQWILQWWASWKLLLAALQNLKATTAELIATDAHWLDSILRDKIIAFLSSEKLDSLSEVLGFEVPYSLQGVINVCHRLDGLEFEASYNMQVFDELALYVTRERNLSQKAMQDYHKAFETRTQKPLNI